MACEPKRISELTRTKTLNPEDLFTLVQCGENKAINAEDLINEIIKLVGGDGDALCLALQAKNLAMKASADAEQALKDMCKAFNLAKKALDTACSFSSRLDRIETIVNRFEELQQNIDILNQYIEQLKNRDIHLTSTTDPSTGVTTYTLTQDSLDGESTTQIGTIQVTNYTSGDEYITVTNGKIGLNANKLKYTGVAPINVSSDREISLDAAALAGQNIAYNTSTKKFDVTLPSGDKSLGDLTDTTISTPPSEGDILYYDGSKWINKPLADLLLWKKASDANGDYLTPNDINKGSVGEQGTVRAGKIYSNTNQS